MKKEQRIREAIQFIKEVETRNTVLRNENNDEIEIFEQDSIEMEEIKSGNYEESEEFHKPKHNEFFEGEYDLIDHEFEEEFFGLYILFDIKTDEGKPDIGCLEL